MTRIPTDLTGQQPVSPKSNQQATDLREVDMDQFLQLLITELQNQDPLDPMNNSDILQQISQIREIGATNQLSDTLAAVLAGQNLATASGLIGKRIHALSDSSEDVVGIVDRVSVEVSDETDQRLLKVHIGQQSIALENIREIVNEGDRSILPLL